MEISNKKINNLEKIELKKQSFGNNNQEAIQTQNEVELPNSHSVGQSIVNSNLPVSYTKIGEINIPGIKDKASIFKLANGQKVIICPKQGPTYIKTTYNVGSMNETEDIRGMSHYIEHNLFNGSKDLAPRDYDKKVSELGAGTNASTCYSSTDYYIALQLLKEDSLEKAIWLNAMQTQFPTFPTEQLQKEKEPVKSEIDVYKDMPSDVATSLMEKNLFNIKTNSTNMVLGTKDNINSFTREKVLDYYNTWYTPDNAVTVITGDVNVDETINLVSKYYNKKPDMSKTNQRHNEPIEYNQKPIRQDIIQPNATNGQVVMGFAIPEETSQQENDKIETLLSLLSSSNSRLTKALDKYGISIDCYTEKIQNKPDGAKAIVLSVCPNETQIEDVIKILYQELTYIANNPPSQEELNSVKKQALNYINNISESSSSLNNTLTNISLTNNYNYFEDTKRNIQNTTVYDISETAKKFLDLNKVSMCVSHENSATTNSINQNYTSASTALKYGNVSFGASVKPTDRIDEEISKIKRYKLPNNIEMASIPGNLSAKSNFTLNFNSDELNGISASAFSILNELLERGSLFKDNNTYQQIKNANDMVVSFGVSNDGLSVYANFNDENINDAFGLLKETLMYPNFTEAEFERAKAIIIDSIKSEPLSASDLLFHELYPNVRKYNLKEDRINEINSLTLNDIKNLYSLILQTSEAEAVFTGPTETKPYLQNIVDSQLSTNMPFVRPYTGQRSPSYNIYTQNKEEKILSAAQEQAQADICQAYKFKKPDNADDIAKVKLLEYILGGSMSSRLFSDLREDKKLAYSVGSDIIREKDSAGIVLYIGTTTDSPDPKEGSPENVNIALESFKHNINLLKTENVTEKELEDAKIAIKSEILNSIETNLGKSISFGDFTKTPYGIRYQSEILKSIDNITADDLKTCANIIFKNPPVTSIVASQKTLDTLNL